MKTAKIRIPAPTQVWVTLRPPLPAGRWVVVALATDISNPGSLASDPLVVVFQGEEGKFITVPLASVLADMHCEVPDEIVPMISDRGPVEARFSDSEGNVCLMAESPLGDLLFLGRETPGTDTDLIPAGPPVMVLDKSRVQELIPYLVHFLTHEELPEEAIKPRLS